MPLAEAEGGDRSLIDEAPHMSSTDVHVDRAVQAASGVVQANPHASGGDALALRGLPVLVKGGFGGAVLGSRPDRAVLRLDDGRRA